MGLLFGGLVAALVLQTLVLFGMASQITELHGDVCRIAVTQHVVVVGCG